MRLYDFSVMCKEIQTRILYKDGVYIGKRKDGSNIIVLYQLAGFYVEISYSKYRCIIADLKCFTSTRKLAPFLQNINIEELVKCVG